MNQRQFLEELAQLLQDIPEEERNEALEYYRCYFEDAGIENEASVLEELGSPKQVADSLKRGMDQSSDAGEYTENGYQTVDEKQVPMGSDTVDNATQGRAHGDQTQENEDAIKTGTQPNGWNQSNHAQYQNGSAQYENVHQQNNQSQQRNAQQKQDYGYQQSNTDQGNHSRQGSKSYTDGYQEPESVQRHNRRLRRLLLVPFWIIAVIVMVCVMVAVIAVVVGVAVGIAGGMGGCAVAGIFGLFAGSGIAMSGFVFPGVGVLGVSLLGIALAVLLFLALIAYCRYVLPTAIRGICHATGVVIKSIGGRR